MCSSDLVKPGDIVKVKVLEIEVARKRIALSLRLDDEIGTKGRGPAKEKPRDISKASTTSQAPRKPQEQGGGALAEALRRAAGKNGNGKTRT